MKIRGVKTIPYANVAPHLPNVLLLKDREYDVPKDIKEEIAKAMLANGDAVEVKEIKSGAVVQNTPVVEKPIVPPRGNYRTTFKR
jgi:hypothetical protein